MATVPAQETRNQITASGGQVIYTYQFLLLDENDIDVWSTPVGQTPDPDADRWILGVNYTVTGVGTETGGTVIAVDPATAGDTITEERDTVIERTTDFSVAGQFTAAAVNVQFDRLTMISQEIQTELTQRGLTYQPTDVLGSNREDNILPVLLPNSGNKISVWSKAAGGALVALQIDEADDVNTLRSELASQQNGADGALLVGYYDSVGGGKTVKEKLDELNTLNADLSNNLSNATCGARLVGYNPNSNAVTVRKELETLGNTRTVPMDALLNGALYEVTLPGTIFPFTSYDEDATYKIKFDAPNPSDVDLNINSIGTKDLRDASGNELEINALEAGSSALVYYNSTADEFRVLSETPGSVETWASKADVQANLPIDKGVYLQNFNDHPLTAKAWANCSTTIGVSQVINDSLNVLSLTQAAPNVFRITFETITMLNSNYAIMSTFETSGNSDIQDINVTAKTTTYFEFSIVASDGSTPGIEIFSLLIFGKTA